MLLSRKSLTPTSAGAASAADSGVDLRWQKLSPAEFQQLQDYQSGLSSGFFHYHLHHSVHRSTLQVDKSFHLDSPRKLKDVLDEFNENGLLAKYKSDDEVSKLTLFAHCFMQLFHIFRSRISFEFLSFCHCCKGLALHAYCTY